jgi:hypothetical protein
MGFTSRPVPSPLDTVSTKYFPVGAYEPMASLDSNSLITTDDDHPGGRMFLTRRGSAVNVCDMRADGQDVVAKIYDESDAQEHMQRILVRDGVTGTCREEAISAFDRTENYRFVICLYKEEVESFCSRSDSDSWPSRDRILPGPGSGPGNAFEPPPGESVFVVILNWGSWCAVVVCVGGVVIIAVRMAVRHQRGEVGGHVASLIIVGGGAVIIVSARLFAVHIFAASG